MSFGSDSSLRQLRTPDASRPTPFSRPAWPWSSFTHRHTSSSSTISGAVHGDSSTPRNTHNLSTLAEGSTALSFSSVGDRRYASPHGSPPGSQTTRQWSFTAFEWIVNDVSELCAVVEGSSSHEGSTERAQEDEMFEVLREHPSVGDGKFILEVARTPMEHKAPSTPTELLGPLEGDTSDRIPCLSLYITSLMDHTNMDSELSASLLVAIKCVDERASDRGAPADWAWDCWEQNWCFKKESEFWECPLPTLSSLLQHPNIRATNSFIICVQIHCPVGPFVPQLPSAHYIPRDLLDGFEASLDNAHTGDVVFVTLERSSHTGLSAPQSPRSMSSHSRHSAYRPQTARKRVIYAHSDILKRRSSYFNTMLSSSFSEATTLAPEERKLHTIVVEDADFVSLYWLLKWVYTNWVLFKEEDDPRAVLDLTSGGFSVRRLAGGTGEWDWRTIIRPGPASESAGSRDGTESEARASRSGASIDSASSMLMMPRTTVETIPERKSPSASETPSSSTPLPSTTTTAGATDVFARLHAGGANRPPSISTTHMRKPSSIPIPTTSTLSPITYAKRGPPSRASKSPMQTRKASQASHQLSSDPHPHPANQAEPASALAVYRISHRYILPGLAALALDHMMATLTPRSAFPLLLASHYWDDLHNLVEDYIVEHWDLVSQEDHFEACCEEVAAGEWGPHGGRTLAALFRRLRSPAPVRLGH